MSIWLSRRKKPYTVIGVQRSRCIRCDRPAKFQWCICADDNNYRPVCARCDIELNALVLEWAGCPPEIIAQKMLDYVDWVTGGRADEVIKEIKQ